MKEDHILKSPEESLIPFLPNKDHKENIVEVMTKDGLGELHLLREANDRYFITFYKPNQSAFKNERIWQSGTLRTPLEVDRAWSNCWTGPEKIFP